MSDLIKAAILRQYAGELYQGHTIGGEWDGEHIKAEHDELMVLADRLALAQSGEVVAYTDGHGMLWLPGERVTMSGTPIPLFAHPVPAVAVEPVIDSGKMWSLVRSRVQGIHSRLSECNTSAEFNAALDSYSHVLVEEMIEKFAAHPDTDRVAELEAQLAESREWVWRIRAYGEQLLDAIDEPPDANCSCHLSPPCSDCVDYGYLRESIRDFKAALAADQEKNGE